VQDVELRITSTTGETIATFKQGAKSSGKYAVEWNGKTADGRDVPQGAYMVSLFVNGRKQNDVKVIRVK
jgi:flagellar hook assembly protein FlgD